MKKTIFILTLLLPICFLFAQPQSFVKQENGGFNFVKVTQVGEENLSEVHTVGWFNAFSYVAQNGDGVNYSDVDQDGWLNSVNVKQENEFLKWNKDRNNSDIDQDGTFNRANVHQIAPDGRIGAGRKSDVDQEGKGNYAKVYQNGQKLDANIQQFAHGNNADVKQEGSLIFANVYQQNDDKNKAKVVQSGKLIFADVNQPGERNEADVMQDGFWVDVDVLQEGEKNDADVVQRGSFLYADVNQPGNDNEADVRQQGTSSYANSIQHGEDGNVKQFQGQGTYIKGELTAYDNHANITQGPKVSGESNAEQYQEGMQNNAVIDQNSGHRSKAVQIQVNAKEGYTKGKSFFHPVDVNQALITQWGGKHNTAYQVQHNSDEFPDAGPNIANVLQIGSGHYSQEVQIGGDNDSDVYQEGLANTSIVSQNFHTTVGDPGFDNLPIKY